jgi:phospholipid transport system substrate-binding protein
MPNALLPIRALARRSLPALFALTCLAVSPIVAEGDAVAAGPQKKGGEAMQAFKAQHERVIKKVKQKASAAKLQKEVDGLLDYAWIAQAALGGPSKYQQNCSPRCDEFEKLLTRLIRENYLRLIRKAENHPVEYVNEVRGRKGAAKVTTRIQVVKNGRKQKLEVAYVMHQTANGWEVRDIITDGMSLAKTYRFEFNQVRKREGIDGVIANLETKLAEIAKMD